MRKLTKSQVFLYALGGILMVSGAGCFVLQWHQSVACWIYLAGTILFSVIQSMQLYDGPNSVVRRLKRIMNVADLLLVLSGILMADTCYHFLLPLFAGKGSDAYYSYIEYVYNKWVILLLIATMLELYTTLRIENEIKKT